jgi:maltose alpha-D-glucosyltransferase/alpha-amylase
MLWSADRHGGFSRAEAAALYSPVIADAVYGCQGVNVESQRKNPASLFHWMRRMIAARKRSQVFGRGTLRFLQPVNTRVLAHLREHEGEPVELDLAEFAGAAPVEMLDGARFPPIGTRPYFLSLGPYGFYWFRLERPGDRQESYGIEATAI